MTIAVSQFKGFFQMRRCLLDTHESVFQKSTMTWRKEVSAYQQSRKQCPHPLSHHYGRQPRRKVISQMNWPKALPLYNQAQPKRPQDNLRSIFLWYDLRLWNHIKLLIIRTCLLQIVCLSFLWGGWRQVYDCLTPSLPRQN